MSTSYDAIVIGSGQAGPSLAVRLAEAGMKTALVEREHLGGTCVNDGCIPTKTLVASARAAHVARRAADCGVHGAGRSRVDMKAVKARKDAVVRAVDRRPRRLDRADAEPEPGLGPRPLRRPARDRGRRRSRSRRRGSSSTSAAAPVLPAWPGIADVPVLDNTSMMAVDFLPEHLIVVGGSYIGLEFAQMYRRFGSRVTVLEHGDRADRPRGPTTSRREVQEILEREGVRLPPRRRSAQRCAAARRRRRARRRRLRGRGAGGR